MKILLILPKINSGCQWNVGLAFISSVLKKGGHKVSLVEYDKYPQDNDILFQKIKSFQPGIIGIGANSHQFFYACKISDYIKKEFNIPIFVGGVHTVLKPESILDCAPIDGVCIGEGEFSFLELVNRMEAKQDYFNLENFWFREKDGEIIKNKRGGLVKDLNKLPIPDRKIFSYFSEDIPKTPRFIFSRGCPFECTYCCNHAFKKSYQSKGQYLRWCSVEQALDEMEEVRNEFGFKYFKLDDDTFSLNKVWMREFCEKLASKNWGVTFECNIRPGTIEKEDMRILKKAGCRMIKIGIESGDLNLRKSIMKRNFSNEDIIKTFDLAKEFGIDTFSFNIIGVPGETKKTIQETINLNKRVKPSFMQVTAFYPYPMTFLGDLCFEKGYVGKEYEDSYMEKSVLRLPTISAKEIERAVKNFKFKVYWSYDKKKAIKEKFLNIRKFIIKTPILYLLAKTAYRPIKFIKKNA